MAMPETIESEDKTDAAVGDGSVTNLAITGMNCGNCARHVTEALQSAPGVRGATVSLDSQSARVVWKTDAPRNVDGLIQAVETAGYGAKVVEAESHEHGPAHSVGGWQLNLWIGVAGTLPLMIGEWLLQLGAVRWFQWFSFVLAAIVQVFAGARFYRGAWSQLKIGSSNMDTLVALGSTTAFAYSTWALCSNAGGHLYFMEAAAIITLISVGHWVESRVGERASSALHKLLRLAPATARRRKADGSETEVPVRELKPGDLVALRPGDHVPTDGEVIDGESAVDESMLTGESVPAEKKRKDRVYAGTVNVDGRVVVRITAIGEQTALAHIIEVVQRAQTSRANIQRLGDRVSSVFVPIVVAVALGAALWWGLAPESAKRVHEWLAQFLWVAHPPASAVAAAFIIGAAVLIVACPCAMGLATPAAIMAGSNAAAERGILIRDGIALEKAGRIEAVLFDKTGTLTVGKPSVAGIWPEIGNPKSEIRNLKSGASRSGSVDVLSLAASLARHSNHPVSRAIAGVSQEESDLGEWREIRGAGVEAMVRRQETGDRRQEHLTPALSPSDAEREDRGVRRQETVRLGSLKWLADAGVELVRGKDFVQQWSSEGATVVGLSVGNSLLALFAVKDVVKPGAAEVIKQLQSQRLEVYLVTGDNQATATSIAKQVGVPAENVFAEVRPEQKGEIVKRLQQEGRRVAFVGDGINDAPALEQADLGIAVSRASDIAREAADIILLNSEIEAVPESLSLARATLRTIKQNLFWAFVYNALSVPLAALGFMSPILCAAAMGLSDLVVIGNALRLRRMTKAE
jgi:Cu+-exporting ATPase